jgi:hypothetical protein
LELGGLSHFFFLLINSLICYQDIRLSKKLRLNLYFRRLEVIVAALFH